MTETNEAAPRGGLFLSSSSLRVIARNEAIDDAKRVNDGQSSRCFDTGNMNANNNVLNCSSSVLNKNT